MPKPLIELFSGWERHNSFLVKAITPLNSDQLSWTPAHDLWSVRRVANHIIGVRAWWFNGWMAEGGQDLARFTDFDDVKGADDHHAQTIVEGLDSTWSSLAACLRKWSEADLAVSFQRPVPNREGERPWRTRQYIIWHVAEHDVHHGGEISLTLGMHGLSGLDI